MIARSDTGDRERPWNAHGQQKSRVAVIDDHAAFRQALVVMLERHGGFEVCAQAESSAEARRTLGALTPGPDLVILDLELDGQEAQELARELCEGTSVAGVIGLSKDGDVAETPEKVRVLGTNVPADEILSAARQLVG